MNTIGIALVWCVVQVTLIGLLASGLYLLLRRLRPAGAELLVLSSLAMVMILSLLAVSPWPRWSIHQSYNSAQSAEASANVSAPSPADFAEEISHNTFLPPTKPRSAPGEGQGARAVDIDPVPSISRPSSAELFWQAIVEELAEPQDKSATNAWRWPAVAAVVLLVAMAGGLGWLVLGVLAVRRQRIGSRPVQDDKLWELVDVLRAELGCHRPIEVRQSDDLVTAATVGWRRPVLLLPADWQSWTVDQRRAVLAHEISHARSRDFPALLFGQLALVLHFYHPLMHWLIGRLRLEQELSADAAAASVSGGQRKYLTTIAELALHQQERPLLWPARMFLPTRDTFLRKIAVLRDNKLRFERLSPLTRIATVGTVLLCGLLVAGLRGPGGFGSALADDQSPQVSKESSKTKFEARLPSGIMIELLGVSENPSKDKPWWRPDGSPLGERPYDSMIGPVSSDQSHVAREFAVLLHKIPSEPVGTQMEFKPTYNAAAGGNPKLINKYEGKLDAMAVSLPDQATVTVRFAVADGPWETIWESWESGGREQKYIGTQKGSFGFLSIDEKDRGVTVALVQDIIGPEMRVIAVGVDGREHRASASSEGGAGNFSQILARFSKLSVKDVKGFRLQKRPYHWIEFRNVSLHPGQKTDVQIVLTDKPALEEGPPLEPLILPRRIYPPWVDPTAAGKRALEKYDANRDGKISGPELDYNALVLKAALDTIDTNRDNAISADEIAARIKAWQDSKVGLIGSITCQVVRDGKPVEGAEVKFVPDNFLGENMKTAYGITGRDGIANMSIKVQGPDNVPGVMPGFYSVEITKPGEDIPAKYNSQTIFGVEIAPDVMRQPELIFDIGK
jgi:beta-lactamase regulating signal transducer with metallopeptidase domain